MNAEKRKEYLVILLLAAFLVPLSIFINASTSDGYAAEDKRVNAPSKTSDGRLEKLEKDIDKYSESRHASIEAAAKQSIDTANSLISYIGFIATTFGIIIALAGIFLGIEGIRSRQRREEAVRSLEQAKNYVGEKLTEFDAVMKTKFGEIDKLCKESIYVGVDQLNRDIEQASKEIQESREHALQDIQGTLFQYKEEAVKNIKEIGEKGLTTEAQQRVMQLEKRIKFFEEIGIPDDPKLLYSKAKILIEKKMYDESLELLKKVVDKENNAYFQIGWAEAELGHFDKAIEAYKKYIEIYPEESAAYNNIGVAFAKQGKLEEALSMYQTAYEMKPDKELYKANIETMKKKLSDSKF